MQRYFIDEAIQVEQQVILTGETAHHMLKVMRMQPGHRVELVTPDEQAFIGELTELDATDKTVTITVQSPIAKNVELPIQTTIVCGLSKGDKTDWIVQKGTQLGAYRFIFCNSQFAVARWDDKKQAKKIARLQKIAQEAAEQAHRTHVPIVEWRNSLAAVAQEPATIKLVAYEESAKDGEHAQLVQSLQAADAGDQLLCVFGPEGGVAPKEIEMLTAAGFKLAGLGPRILRAETAPLYLLSVISYVTELATL
ncbi:16S rRNA (uracil(1498)-N(3))-methyltransferase [Lactobacillus curvatus]|nr:16S rRNA (uracil(1498)-N(3))-methyltransferase [Latilactobacillus curvatus]MSE23424.1 16S rRNA (uracil(1498)-N(3))-methyltransferase [Latilactobacillus curvatus]